ncbi:MAG: hypothetical protein QNJ81_09985 [Acidimicrobiia bacterium]|nr:hypothetical protein [Acidimicrobiia bacterium]
MPIEILLLLALPASGKSELRRYLESLDPVAAQDDLHLGASVQIDDYPYVHMMRRIAEEVVAAGDEPIFFASVEHPFLDPRDWGTLMHLINLDFAELTDPPDAPMTGTAARWLFARIDRARQMVGLPAAIASLEPLTLKRLESALEFEAQTVFDTKAAVNPANLEGKTVVIEFARGGPEGSQLPLPPPYGYAYSLSLLSDEILSRASILYVWVDPEDSRRKNEARAKPGRDGDASILFHGVPEAVMRQEYGTDDLMWLLAAGGGSHVLVDKGEDRYALSTGVFDNREDLTSFLRDDPAKWSQFEIRQLHNELMNATAGLRSSSRR